MERREFVRFWAKYLREHPEKAWPQYVKFINSLYRNKPDPKVVLEMLKKTGKLDKKF